MAKPSLKKVKKKKKKQSKSKGIQTGWKTGKEKTKNNLPLTIVNGKFKSGKTHFCISHLKYLNELGYNPDEILVLVIDFDWDSSAPLIKDVIPDKLQESIKINCVAELYGFEEVLYDSFRIFEKHYKKYDAGRYKIPPRILIIENIQNVYESVRFKHMEETRGVEGIDWLTEKRKESVKIKKKVPELNRRDDYAIINPRYQSIYQKIRINMRKNNFISFITAPYKKTINYESNKEKVIYKERGRPDLIKGFAEVIMETSKKIQGTNKVNFFWKSVDNRYGKSFKLKKPNLKKYYEILLGGK